MERHDADGEGYVGGRNVCVCDSFLHLNSVRWRASCQSICCQYGSEIYVYGCSSHQGTADGKCGKYAYALQAAARSVNIYADLKVGAM